MEKPLSMTYKINKNFQRAKRIDVDFDLVGINDYKLNETTWKILNSFFDEINNSNQKAFTWTGPYGSGKSSLALLLSALVAPQKDKIKSAAKNIIGSERYKNISKYISSSDKGWLVIRIVGRREDPANVLYKAIRDAWIERWGEKDLKRFESKLEEISQFKKIIKLIEFASSKTLAENDGLIIIIDEMGKFLEFAALEGGDLHVFQELAEVLSRTDGRNALLGILHQSFDEYARRSNRDYRNEWSKIQGRFIDIPFSIALEEIVFLISNSIINNGADNKKFLTLCRNVSDSISSGRIKHIKNLPYLLNSCIPLHPLTSLMLGPISRRRFGQNERSVFSFLSSNEPKSFSEFLDVEISKNNKLYSLSDLWDYLQLNYEPTILVSPDGSRWAEAAEAILRVSKKDEATDQHIETIKTIAILDLFGTAHGINPTNKILPLALNAPEGNLNKITSDLSKWSTIISRKHINGWGIFSGSDIDIDLEATKAREFVANDHNLILSAIADIPPIVAKRHYAEKGTLRIFERRIIDRNEIQKFSQRKSNLSGKFLLCIDFDKDKKLINSTDKIKFSKNTEIGPTTLLSSISYDHQVVENAITVASLERVRITNPQIEGDPAARRELSAKINRSRHELSDTIRETFSKATWYWRDPEGEKEESFTSVLSEIASFVSDKVYKDSPVIINELLNRDNPSSQAIAARRRLATAMIERSEQNRLGIIGAPAEFGLYLSIFEKPGIHTRLNEEIWHFTKPKNPTFIPLWDKATDKLSNVDRPVSIREIIELWREPPFGLRNGVTPILLLSFILANLSSIALYIEGNLVLAIDELFLDRYFQNPDIVSIRWVETNSISAKALQDLADFIVKQKIGSAGTTALEVTKPLVRFAQKLPGWTRRTKDLSQQAIDLREVLLGAKDPHELLFKSLPELFGTKNLKSKGKEKSQIDFVKLKKSFEELQNKFNENIEFFKSIIFDNLQINFGESEGISELSARALSVMQSKKYAHDLLLIRCSESLSKANSDSDNWIIDLLGILSEKFVRDWTDSDRGRSIIALNSFLETFQQAEASISASEQRGNNLELFANSLISDLESKKLNKSNKRAILLLALKLLNERSSLENIS